MLTKSRENFPRQRISNEAAWAWNELIRNQEIGNRSCQIKRVRNREAGTCSISRHLALVVLFVDMYSSHREVRLSLTHLETWKNHPTSAATLCQLEFVAPCKGMATGNSPENRDQKGKRRNERKGSRKETKKTGIMMKGGKRCRVTQAGRKPSRKAISHAPKTSLASSFVRTA